MICSFYFYTAIAYALHELGAIHSDLEEFEEAQKCLQSAFETYKSVLGVTNKETFLLRMEAGKSARMAGKLQDAKEILEDSLPKGKYNSIVAKQKKQQNVCALHCMKVKCTVHINL